MQPESGGSSPEKLAILNKLMAMAMNDTNAGYEATLEKIKKALSTANAYAKEVDKAKGIESPTAAKPAGGAAPASGAMPPMPQMGQAPDVAQREQPQFTPPTYS